MSKFNTIFKKVVATAQITIGVFFLLMMAGDIQLGFGLVLLTQGLLNYE